MKNEKYVILYVDDDQDFLDSIRSVLESNGYIMEEALTAEEGLKKYKATNPDFILVDLMMEEVDSGVNLVKELRLLNNSVPIYLLSSVGDQMNSTTSYSDLGLAGVFSKPVDPVRLLDTIKAKLN